MFKFIEHCKDGATQNCSISVNNMLSAEKAMLRRIQRTYLKEELTTYSNKTSANKCRKGTLWKLDPLIDSEGLLRVGGRNMHSN